MLFQVTSLGQWVSILDTNPRNYKSTKATYAMCMFQAYTAVPTTS